MPAPPSRDQTDAKNAAVSRAASTSKNTTSNNYGGINTSTPSRSTSTGNNSSGSTGLSNSLRAATNPGGLYSGNNSSASQLASRISAVSRGPGSVAGVMPGASPLSQQRTINNLSGAMNDGGMPMNPRDLQRLSQTIAGESAGQPPMGQTAVGNTMINRMALAAANRAKYMGGGNVNSLMAQYDATGMRPGTTQNSVYQNAQLGTDTLGSGIASIAGAVSPNSKFNTEMPTTIKEATHFYNPKTSNPKWGGPQFSALGDHVFGMPDELAGKGSIVTAARGVPQQKPDVQYASKATPKYQAPPEYKPATYTPEFEKVMAPINNTMKYFADNPIKISLANKAGLLRAPVNNYLGSKIRDMQQYLGDFMNQGKGTSQIADTIVNNPKQAIQASPSLKKVAATSPTFLQRVLNDASKGRNNSKFKNYAMRLAKTRTTRGSLSANDKITNMFAELAAGRTPAFN